MTIESTLNSMTKEQLVSLALQLGTDGTFNLMTRDVATIFHGIIETGKTLVMIDLANVHALNHKYGMCQADAFINNVLCQFRHSDTWIRWGGDELVVILNDNDVVGFIGRFDSIMAENNLYAVYAHVTTSESLVETVNRADVICMQAKLQLEKHGLKAGCNEEYKRLTSTVVTE